MRFVVPDTNVILHFRPIAGVTANDLGLSGDFTWLVVGEMMHELDIRKGTGPKPLRGRARKAIQAFEKAEMGAVPWSGANPLAVHVRTRDFDFEAKGLMRHEADHRILADILDFRADHPADEILLLSDDSVARMRARKYGFATIDAPESLARPELDDDRDVRIRELEEENRALSAAQPNLALAFEDEKDETTVEVASFNHVELEKLLHRAASPEPEEELGPNPFGHSDFLQGLAAAMPRRANPNYDEQLAAYADEFREYFLKSWVQTYRTVEIAPVLYSRNGVEANGVNVRIHIKTDANVLSDLPESVEKPDKPHRKLSPFAAHSPYLFDRRTFESLLPVREFDRLRPSVDRYEGGATVRYALLRLAQEDATRLDPFYLIFAHDNIPPKAIELVCEVRAKNMTTVIKSRLLVRFTISEQSMPAGYLIDANS